MTSVFSQNVRVTDIQLTGNTKTKDFVIIRELLFQKDSNYLLSSNQDLEYMIEQSKNRILNLNLFNQVEISLQPIELLDSIQNYTMDIVVVEKWYIWPMPLIEFSDRNFNVWGDLDFDPDRTNYGLFVYHYNVFGRNHTMKTKLKTGYNTQAGVEYRIPFLSPNTQWGVKGQIDYNAQNEVWYQTRNDSLQFFKNGEKNLIQTTYASVEFSKRIAPFVKLFMGASFTYGKLNDAVPSALFYTNSSDYQRHTNLSYRIEHDTRDNIYFPMKGTFISPTVSVSQFQNTKNDYNIKFELKAQQFFQIRPKWYSAFSIYGQANGSNELGYNNRKQLGYDQTIRGFEHYVVDGTFGAKATAAIRYHLVDKSDLTLDFIPFKNYKMLPFNAYLECFTDGGFAANDIAHRTNLLPNEALYSVGLGLNTLFYNDRLLRLEYSLNSLKEGGFFVHFKKAI